MHYDPRNACHIVLYAMMHAHTWSLCNGMPFGVMHSEILLPMSGENRYLV